MTTTRPPRLEPADLPVVTKASANPVPTTDVPWQDVRPGDVLSWGPSRYSEVVVATERTRYEDGQPFNATLAAEGFQPGEEAVLVYVARAYLATRETRNLYTRPGGYAQVQVLPPRRRFDVEFIDAETGERYLATDLDVAPTRDVVTEAGQAAVDNDLIPGGSIDVDLAAWTVRVEVRGRLNAE